MLFQVRNIEFDFSDAFDDPIENEYKYKEDLHGEIYGSIWEADDEDDLVEEITCATGWCINSIEFVNVLS